MEMYYIEALKRMFNDKPYSKTTLSNNTKGEE